MKTADLKAFDPQNEKDSEICMIWIALNSVDFWGNEEAVINHYHLLRKYRTKVAKITGCRAADLPKKYHSSDMLPQLEEHLEKTGVLKGYWYKR